MKKRIITMLCTLVLLVTSLVPVVASANVHYFYVHTSNGKSLNLRKAPIAHANNKIGNIPNGTEVIVHEYVNNNSWAYVEYNGRMGYVMTRYLSKTKPAVKPPVKETPTELNFAKFVQTNYIALVRSSAPGGWVNLRWAPSKSMAVREKVYDGQRLEVIAKDATWAQVRDPVTDVVGFIMCAFLTEIH